MTRKLMLLVALGLPLSTVWAADRPLDELSKQYGVTTDQVLALREKGLGWGEIGHALAIAQKSGKPLSDVLALRDKGMGWGAIARQYGFTLGEVTDKAKEFEKKAEGIPDRDAPREADKDKKDDSRTAKLAKEFGVEPAVIDSLRDDGFGWGEVRHALAIAQKAGVPVSDVEALRDKGMGWGQIAGKYGFTLGDVTRKGVSKDTDKDEEKRERREERRERSERGAGEGAHSRAPEGMRH